MSLKNQAFSIKIFRSARAIILVQVQSKERNLRINSYKRIEK